MTTETYDFNLLANGGETAPELSGLIAGVDETARARFSLEMLRLGSDLRIPRDAVGYVHGLSSPTATRAFREDCLRMLARHVPIMEPVYQSGPNGSERVGERQI